MNPIIDGHEQRHSAPPKYITISFQFKELPSLWIRNNKYSKMFYFAQRIEERSKIKKKQSDELKIMKVSLCWARVILSQRFTDHGRRPFIIFCTSLFIILFNICWQINSSIKNKKKNRFPSILSDTISKRLVRGEGLKNVHVIPI